MSPKRGFLRSKSDSRQRRGGSRDQGAASSRDPIRRFGVKLGGHRGISRVNQPHANEVTVIPPREAGTGLVHVLIDTPRGSGNKYKYDERLRTFRISRILPAGMHFPYDFGSVPGTCAEDGDPLDVVVLLDQPTFPGCLVTTRLIGGFRARQRESGRMIRNDRLIAVPETPVNPARMRSIRSLHAGQLREIQHFFVSYNQAQGRELKIASAFGASTAQRLLADAIRAYRNV